jgi:uncharacterized phiE125 gp8 family phage protein
MTDATAFIAAPWYLPPVTSVLVVAPTEEPLTLDEGKLRAGLTWASGDPRDDLMNGFIAAARAQVEFDTGLALLTQTRAITFYGGVGWATDSGVVPLPMQALPLQSLTDPDGNPVPLSRFRDGFRRRVAALQVDDFQSGTWTIVSGWPDAAALRAEAPLLVQAVGLLVAHYATVGRDLTIVGTIVATTPQGYDACINPYRLVTLA